MLSIVFIKLCMNACIHNSTKSYSLKKVLTFLLEMFVCLLKNFFFLSRGIPHTPFPFFCHSIFNCTNWVWRWHHLSKYCLKAYRIFLLFYLFFVSFRCQFYLHRNWGRPKVFFLMPLTILILMRLRKALNALEIVTVACSIISTVQLIALIKWRMKNMQ